MSKQAIQAHAEGIKVPFLLHFTRIVNLPTIMRYGLYPVKRTTEIGVTPAINDELRLDGHQDGTSLSIAFPNYRMFWKCRHENVGVDWVVLFIHRSVLWIKDCAFCRYNAADTRICLQPLDDLKTPLAFASMFDEIEGAQPRNEQRLMPFDPTDGQAEVLVFDVIEPNLITGAAFDNVMALEANLYLLGNRQILLNKANKSYFAARSYVR